MSEGYCFICVVGKVLREERMMWFRCDRCGTVWKDEDLIRGNVQRKLHPWYPPKPRWYQWWSRRAPERVNEVAVWLEYG